MEYTSSSSSSIRQRDHEVMVDEQDDDLGSVSSFSDDEASSNSTDSSSSELSDNATSASPLYQMSSLIPHLPFKRGLSKHFEGKSQSFASLSNVSCVDDLVKPERPCKKLKLCKDINKQLYPRHCSGSIAKKASRSSLSSLIGARRHAGVLGRKPPISPQTSGSQTLLFA